MFLHTAAIRNSPSSVPFSSLPGSLKTCVAALSLSKPQNYTQPLKKTSFWCTGTKVQVPYYDPTGKLFSHFTKLHPPSPSSRKAMTLSSSALLSQEGVYLLIGIFSPSPFPPQLRGGSGRSSSAVPLVLFCSVLSEPARLCLELHTQPGASLLLLLPHPLQHTPTKTSK